MLKKEELNLLAVGQGCLGKAADDEPIFTLRGQDLLAAQLVRDWADLLEVRAIATGSMTKERKLKIDEARELARMMDAWPTRKLPD